MTLTQANYHSLAADAEYMSVHQFQNWIKCAAKEYARQKGLYVDPPNRNFLLGSYVDAALTESPADFEAFYRDNSDELLTKSGKKRADIITADKMIERLRADDFCMKLLSGESQAILTGEIQGVLWKGKADVIHRAMKFLVDLKTTKDFKDGWIDDGAGGNLKVQWFSVWNYWLQMAVYQELLRQMTGEVFKPIIVAVSKEDPCGIDLPVMNDTYRLERELSLTLAPLEAVMRYKRGDEPAPRCESLGCDWCRGTKDGMSALREVRARY